MSTKTFKIGEYVVGGIIKVTTKKEKVTVEFKDFFTKEVLLSKVFGCREKDERAVQFYLMEHGTPYYADKVMDWLKTKVEFQGW